MLAAGIPRIRLLAALLALIGVSAPASAAPVQLPGGRTIANPDFERHVMAVFSKAGCNNGSCHGSFQGKNGFRLSLFGLDPDKDYAALTRDNLGRRVDPVSPDDSLLLLKSIGATRHDGGMRFGRNTWQYKLLREWAANGARWTKGSGVVTGIAVNPPEVVFAKPEGRKGVTVTATFADGSTEDVTPLCDFRVHDEGVAEVSPNGELTAKRPGDTALVVSYRGQVQSLRALVPAPAEPGFVYPKVPRQNFIDEVVFTKLKRLNMVPSDLSSDSEFLRRVYLDTIGTLPTPDEARAFFADTSADKRAKKIDELLAHPLHAALWATKFSDITGNNTDALERPQQRAPKLSQMWHDWFAKRVADNMPYDKIVEGVLTATSRDGAEADAWLEQVRKIEGETEKGFETSYPNRASLDLFWRRQQNVPIEQWGEKTAAAFLGVRLECAQCHKHPTDRWTQADYRSYANVFAGVTFGISPEAKKAIDDENAARKKAAGEDRQKQQNVIPVREVFIGKAGKPLTHPETNAPLPAKAPLGPEVAVKPGDDPRREVMEWLRKPDNPFFARAFVNRVWGHYFGVGIVDPVDDFSLANAPSNPALLDALAKEFVESGFDIRKLERAVLLSRTYQLSAVPNATNKHDKINYAKSYVRPLMAETVVDTLNAALGVDEQFGNEAPAGRKMIEVGSSRLQNPTLAYTLRIFGRPPRTTACDCERAMDPALPQTLFRMSDGAIVKKLETGNNRVAQIVAKKLSDDATAEELFLATLTRLPNAQERAKAVTHLAKAPQGKERNAAVADLLWALINTREFILNH